MTDSIVSLWAGILLSLIFSYVPGVKERFDARSATEKRLIMLAALLVVSIGLFAAACGKVLGNVPIIQTISCDQNGLVTVATYFVLALIANQAAYLVTPKPGEVVALDQPK